MEYEVTLHTGARPDAESDGHVGIRVVGATSTLDDTVLEHGGRTRFRPGAIDVFTVQAPTDLGALLYVELFVAGKPWFVDRAVVRAKATGREWVFPFYAFVTAQREMVFEGSASLPQHDPVAVRDARRHELERRREVYDYVVPANGLPPMLKEQNLLLLPLDEQFTPGRTEEFEAKKKDAEWNAKLAYVREYLTQFDGPRHEQHLYPILHRPDVSASYAEDAELSWQTVAGVAPNHVRRARTVADLPSVWKDAAGLDEALGRPLADAIDAGLVHFLDDSMLEGIPKFESAGLRRYAPSGSCLFLAEPRTPRDDASRGRALELVPKAIRLAPNGRIFTPRDGDSWLLAKTYVRTSEANIHQVVTHAVRTHLALEPYVLATMRCLSSKHPIYKLMRRHFRGTIRINAEARQLLLAQGGVFDEFIAIGGPKQGHLVLAAKAYEAFEISHNHPARDLVARGFEGGDAAKLAIDYPFADASLDLYLAISEYVSAAIAPYYPDAAALAADPEVAAFLDELRAYARVGDLAEPSSFGFTKLVEILSLVVYTGSVLHAGVNFQQYDHFGFVPNAPAAMRQPPDETVSADVDASGTPTIADAEWMRRLPDLKQTLRQLTVSYSLSRRLDDDEYLLPPDGRAWREAYFVEPSAIAAIARFHDALRATKERITARNAARGRAYTCLLPDQVPASTTI